MIHEIGDRNNDELCSRYKFHINSVLHIFCPLTGIIRLEIENMCDAVILKI